MGSLASQTTLGYDNNKRGKRPRIPKIKSFGDDVAAARSNHDRDNKNIKPSSPTFLPDYLVNSTGNSLPSAHASPPPVEKKSTKAKIKPLLRKFSSQEQMGVDLSRSAAEHQGISILESNHHAPSRTPSGSIRKGGNFHNRTTSGTSAISTTSSNQYVHPMRQTPQTYPTPIPGSYKNSIDSTQSGQRRRPQLGLHIRTGSHLTNSSQTNLPGTPSSLRFPSRSGNNNDPDVITSPLTARSSLESNAFRKRSRSNTATTDPIQQAASVAQLRQKFQEKEAAKDRKYAEAEAKAQRKKEKKAMQRSRAASEVSSIVGVAYAEKERYPRYEDGAATVGGAKQQEAGTPDGRMTPRLRGKDGMNGRGAVRKKGMGERWLGFWIGVRAWLLKMSKKMGGGNNNKKRKEG